MNKDNTLNENIRKVLDILELRFDIGSKTTFFEDDYKYGKLRVGIWMSDIKDAGLSVEGCWDILSIIKTKLKDFEIVGKFKAGYKNEKYENLASKVDEPPPIFEILLPKDFIEISQKIKNDLFEFKNINDQKDEKGKEKLYLDLIGDLWKEPKNKYCYSMMGEKKRQELLRFMIDQRKLTKQFIPTKDISSDLNKTEQSVRAEIGKINANVLIKLKIGKKKKIGKRSEIENGLLEGRQSSGYRLNLNIDVKLVDHPKVS